MSKTCCIGYVTGAFDRTWKPITSKEQFMKVLESEQVRQTINTLRNTPNITREQKQNIKK